MCTTPPLKNRLHCTIIHQGADESSSSSSSSSSCYMLYLEHLGGLIPLLKGKRASKLHPDFVIFDPQLEGTLDNDVMSNSMMSSSSAESTMNKRGVCLFCVCLCICVFVCVAGMWVCVCSYVCVCVDAGLLALLIKCNIYHCHLKQHRRR